MITVGELKEYFAKNKPKKITYWSENQPDYNVFNPIEARFEFPIVRVFENPNSLALSTGIKSDGFDLVIRRLKFAEFDTKTTVLGTRISLYCEVGATQPKISCVLIVA